MNASVFFLRDALLSGPVQLGINILEWPTCILFLSLSLWRDASLAVWEVCGLCCVAGGVWPLLCSAIHNTIPGKDVQLVSC